MMNIILIAPPAAGKGTQAELLSKKFDIPHISIGDLVRASINDEKTKDLLREGNLLDDNLICCILEERIQKSDCSNGYILDGFPRNLNQAKMYEKLIAKLNFKLGIIIAIEVSKDEALRRVLGRLTCNTCGAVYNETEPTMLPNENGTCKKCGSILERRSDDNIESFMKRFETYYEETKPVIDYYNESHKVHFIKSINIETTFKQIDNIIGNEV